MKFIRLKADLTENEKEYIILSLLVDDENHLLKKYEMFGYVVDEGENGLEEYPFKIRASTQEELLVLQYGGNLEYFREELNLPSKEIILNEYFTRRVKDENDDINEYTYRISNIEIIIDDLNLDVDETNEEDYRTSIPTRYRIARADATVGSIRKKIENIFGIPEGSVVLCGPDERALRKDAKIATLRRQWEQ